MSQPIRCPGRIVPTATDWRIADECADCAHRLRESGPVIVPMPYPCPVRRQQQGAGDAAHDL